MQNHLLRLIFQKFKIVLISKSHTPSLVIFDTISIPEQAPCFNNCMLCQSGERGRVLKLLTVGDFPPASNCTALSGVENEGVFTLKGREEAEGLAGGEAYALDATAVKVHPDSHRADDGIGIDNRHTMCYVIRI
jgi:hypothetical protein